MNQLTTEFLCRMFAEAAQLIIQREPYLTEIDSVIGDGDHGEGMKRGCEALLNLLESRQWEFADDLCYAVGVELIKSMGGASGVIFGTMFLGGVSGLPHNSTITPPEMVRYFYEGERAIEQRGRSKPGNKTMLDALYPACVAMKKAQMESDNVTFILKSGWEGALDGIEECKRLQSKTGRSKNFREKTLGLPDPGAVSVGFWFLGFYNAAEKYENQANAYAEG